MIYSVRGRSIVVNSTIEDRENQTLTENITLVLKTYDEAKLT